MIIGKVPPSFDEYVKGRDSQFPKVTIFTPIMIMGVTCNENMWQVEVFDLWTLRKKNIKSSLFESLGK